MKLSIVTPSYNHAQFIERTIQSVLSQNVQALQFVVFDGGSTDGTLDILKRYEDRLKWVSQPDKGQADAVNQGITATDGEVIGWLNSDDINYPGALQRVLTFFSEHPDVDVVYGKADYIDLDDRPFDAYPTEPWDYEWLKRTCYICQPALFFRRTVVERLGLLDPELMYCMDYEYWLRIAAGGANFAYLQEKLAGSRMYAENKTLGAKLEIRREINDMLRRRLGRVPDRWLYIYAHHVAELRVGQNVQSKMVWTTLGDANGVGVAAMESSHFRRNERGPVRLDRRPPSPQFSVHNWTWTKSGARHVLYRSRVGVHSRNLR
jgi:glycosyltransferase involved in cell wall biosynthesis